MQVPLDELVFYIAYMFKQEAGRAPSLLEIWCVLEELAEHFPEVREELRKICRDYELNTPLHMYSCHDDLQEVVDKLVESGRARTRLVVNSDMLRVSEDLAEELTEEELAEWLDMELDTLLSNIRTRHLVVRTEVEPLAGPGREIPEDVRTRIMKSFEKCRIEKLTAQT